MFVHKRAPVCLYLLKGIGPLRFRVKRKSSWFYDYVYFLSTLNTFLSRNWSKSVVQHVSSFKIAIFGSTLVRSCFEVLINFFKHRKNYQNIRLKIKIRVCRVMKKILVIKSHSGKCRKCFLRGRG